LGGGNVEMVLEYHCSYLFLKVFSNFCHEKAEFFNYFFSRFTINDIPSDNAYIIDLSIALCTESGQACEQDYVITENMLLPKKQCAWDSDFVNASMYSYICNTL
jgi:hypothetical protein